MAWTSQVEVALTTQPMSASPSWTDITAYVMPPVEVTAGRPDEFGEVQPSTLRLRLKDFDGRFTLGKTDGAYAPNVLPGRRIRVRQTRSAVVYNRFDGHVNGWPTTWMAPGGALGVVELTATDRLKRLGEVGELRSMLSEEILRDTGPGVVSGGGGGGGGGGGAGVYSERVRLYDFDASLGLWHPTLGGTASLDTSRSHTGGSGGSPASWTPSYGTSSSGCTNRLVSASGTGTIQQVGGPQPDYCQLIGYFHDTDEYLDLTNGNTPADKYRYISLNWYVAGIPGAVAAIRAAHPRATLLAYQNLAGMRVGPHSYGRPSSLVTKEEADSHGASGDGSWFLHKEAGGGVITFNDFADLYAAHLGRASWRAAASSHFAAVRADGFDGIFLDDLNTFPGHGFSEGDANDSVEFASDNAYRDATVAAMAVLTPAARAAGLVMVGNVAMNPWTADHYAGYLALLDQDALDAVNREFFTNWGSDTVVYTGATWSDTMKVQLDAEARGYPCMLNTYPLSTPDHPRSVRYGLASFLVHWDGVARSGWGYNDGKPVGSYGEYRKHLGLPSEVRQLVSGTEADGAWQRKYYGGIAIVNAKSSGSVTFTLGGTYRDPSNTNVTSVNLAPGNGMVLLAPTGGTTPIVPSGTYTSWATLAGTFRSVRWGLRVEHDPYQTTGTAAGYFWSTQFSFSGSAEAAYCGLQSNGNLPGSSNQKVALFSVFTGVASVRNTAITGSVAESFAEGVGGHRVLIPFAWAAGRDYTLKVERDTPRGARWWAAYVTDDATGVSTWLGSVQASTSQGDLVGSSLSQWTELFAANVTLSSCTDIPYARTFFGQPTFDAAASLKLERTWASGGADTAELDDSPVTAVDRSANGTTFSVWMWAGLAGFKGRLDLFANAAWHTGTLTDLGNVGDWTQVLADVAAADVAAAQQFRYHVEHPASPGGLLAVWFDDHGQGVRT